jgi:Fibronectin type III domain
LYLLPTFAWLKNLVQRKLVPIGFFLGVLVVITSMPFAALEAASVKLSWDPSPDVPVAGYAIYYGTASQIYTDKISLGSATTVTVSNLVAGTTYYFAATAYDDAGLESPFSNEAVYTVPPDPSNQPPLLNPALNSNGQFSFVVSGVAGIPYAVEASTNLVDWVTVTNSVSPFTFTATDIYQNNQEFFRAVYFP